MSTITAWFNPKYKNWNITKKALDGIRVAGNMYIRALVKKISKPVSPVRKIRSLPGEPPRKETGALVEEVKISQAITVESNKVTLTISAQSDKAQALERGTWKMAARPAWVPTFEEMKDKMIERIKKGLLPK